jgi:putative ABC transport system permease protein
VSLSLRLAWRYLMGRKQRSLLTTLAVTIGVMLVYGLNGITPAMLNMLRDNLSASPASGDLLFTSQARGAFPQALAAAVRGVPGARGAQGLLSRSVVLSGVLALPGADGTSVDTLTVQGVEIAEGRSPFELFAGRGLDAADPHGVVVSQALASRAGLSLGSVLRLPAAAGMETFNVVGLAQDAASVYTEPVYMSLVSAQALFNLPGQINVIRVPLLSGTDRSMLSAAVLARLGEDFRLGEIDPGSEFLLTMDIGVFLFNLFGVLAVVMAGFVIFNTFRTLVMERRRDIGMLRALGASRLRVLQLVLAESLLQGGVGTMLGLLAGYALIRGVLWAMAPLVHDLMLLELPQPGFDLRAALLATVLGVGVTVVSALAPAVAASRLSPLEAMRLPRGEPTWWTAPRRLGLAGVCLGLAGLGLLSDRPVAQATSLGVAVLALVMAAPGLVYPLGRALSPGLVALFPRESGLAQVNLARQPVRAAVTVSVVMIGLATLLGMAGVVRTLQVGLREMFTESFPSDYRVMPQSLVLGGGNVGAGPDLQVRLRAVEGVHAVTSLRLSTTRIGAVDVQVLGLDAAAFGQMSGLDFFAGAPSSAYAALAGGRAMLVNGILAVQLGLKPGEIADLLTPNGSQHYRVVGIANDILTAKLSTAYIDQVYLTADFNETSDLALLVNRAAGADPQVVKDRLAVVVAQYPAFALYDSQQWRAALADKVDEVLVVFYWMLFVLAFPALLALINTLGINVLERSREIGTLRAVGATRRQVRRLVLAESLLLAAVGCALGCLAGLWMGYVLVRLMQASGFQFAYVFPWAGLALMALAALGLGTAAAWLPARTAAGMDIAAALRYE